LASYLLCAIPHGLGAGTPAHAQTIGLPSPLALPPEPIFAVPTRLDRVGRVLAPVMVNERGPFRFILDTGANRSVLSPRVAALLQLTPSADKPIDVHGVTGSAVLPAVEIDSLRAGDLVLVRNSRVPVLPETVLADADGILGVEGLSGSRIDIDFVTDRVTISKSRGATAAAGMLAIPVRLRYNGLLVTRASVGRQRVTAIIDTGAERTLGNNALREALRLAPTRPAETVVTTVLGATPALGEGTSLIAPMIRIGDAELRSLEVTFGDLHVFRVWGLEKEPALLIGMDLLGSVERLIIDYRLREIQLKPR
jgi:predicted aspartyl protease